MKLLVDENKLNDEIKASFGEETVEIRGYFEIDEFVKTIDKEEVVLVDNNKITSILESFYKMKEVMPENYSFSEININNINDIMLLNKPTAVAKLKF